MKLPLEVWQADRSGDVIELLSDDSIKIEWDDGATEIHEGGSNAKLWQRSDGSYYLTIEPSIVQ